MIISFKLKIPLFRLSKIWVILEIPKTKTKSKNSSVRLTFFVSSMIFSPILLSLFPTLSAFLYFSTFSYIFPLLLVLSCLYVVLFLSPTSFLSSFISKVSHRDLYIYRKAYCIIAYFISFFNLFIPVFRRSTMKVPKF